MPRAERSSGPAMVLQRAAALFRERGYANTSMADISAACGLTKAGVYHHFPGKEAILDAVLASLERDFLEPLTERRHEGVGSMAAFTVAFMEEAGACVAAQTALEAAREAAAPRLAAFFTRWRDLLAEALAPGRGIDEARMLAEDGIARFEGAMVWLKLFGDAGPLRRAGAALAELAP